MNRKRARCTVKYFGTHILSSACLELQFSTRMEIFRINRDEEDPFVRVENIF